MDNTRATGTKPVTKRIRLAAAVTIPAAALVAMSLNASPGQAASSGDDTNAPSQGKAHKAAVVTKCDGGAQKRVWNRGANGWQYATSDGGQLALPGSVFRVKGPSHGRDTLSVNLSAWAYLSTSTEGRVKVLLDGTPMPPSDPSVGSYITMNSGDYYGTFAQNYCRKIGPGYHNFRVVLQDVDYGAAGTHYFELHDPLVHVEQSE